MKVIKIALLIAFIVVIILVDKLGGNLGGFSAQNRGVIAYMLVCLLIPLLFTVEWLEKNGGIRQLISRIENKYLRRERRKSKEDIQDISTKAMLTSIAPTSDATPNKQKKEKGSYIKEYDQLIEKNVRDQWENLKQGNNIEKEASELWIIRARLKSKRYDDADDWIISLWNFFRPRPMRLQRLLFEIKTRLEEIRRTSKDKKESPPMPLQSKGEIYEREDNDAFAITQDGNESINDKDASDAPGMDETDNIDISNGLVEDNQDESEVDEADLLSDEESNDSDSPDGVEDDDDPSSDQQTTDERVD